MNTDKYMLLIIILLIIYLAINIKNTNEQMTNIPIDQVKLKDIELDFRRELQTDPTNIIKNMTEVDIDSTQNIQLKFTDFFDILL